MLVRVNHAHLEKNVFTTIILQIQIHHHFQEITFNNSNFPLRIQNSLKNLEIDLLDQIKIDHLILHFQIIDSAHRIKILDSLINNLKRNLTKNSLTNLHLINLNLTNLPFQNLNFRINKRVFNKSKKDQINSINKKWYDNQLAQEKI